MTVVDPKQNHSLSIDDINFDKGYKGKDEDGCDAEQQQSADEAT